MSTTRERTRCVRGANVIMACYNMAIPYLVPDLPAAQQKGLSYGVKIPLTYTKVLIPHWRAFAQLGTDFVYYTKDFFKQVELDYPVSIGDYKRSQTPDEPMVLHMCHVHHDGVTKGPEQWREGRRRLMTTSFAQFEGHVRDQLDGPQGGVRRQARHQGHHGEPVAARLRLLPASPVGTRVGIGGGEAVGDRSPAVRAHRHRQLRCGGQGRHQLGHHAGVARGAGVAGLRGRVGAIDDAHP
jgi:hypothetical protein